MAETYAGVAAAVGASGKVEDPKLSEKAVQAILSLFQNMAVADLGRLLDLYSRFQKERAHEALTLEVLLAFVRDEDAEFADQLMAEWLAAQERLQVEVPDINFDGAVMDVLAAIHAGLNGAALSARDVAARLEAAMTVIETAFQNKNFVEQLELVGAAVERLKQSRLEVATEEDSLDDGTVAADPKETADPVEVAAKSKETVEEDASAVAAPAPTSFVRPASRARQDYLERMAADMRVIIGALDNSGIQDVLRALETVRVLQGLSGVTGCPLLNLGPRIGSPHGVALDFLLQARRFRQGGANPFGGLGLDGWSAMPQPAPEAVRGFET